MRGEGDGDELFWGFLGNITDRFFGGIIDGRTDFPADIAPFETV
jgi:hypothetical protein